jgi:hypothetical protein
MGIIKRGCNAMKTYTDMINLSKEYDAEKARALKKGGKPARQKVHENSSLGKELMCENNFPMHAKIGMVFTCYFDHLRFMEYALRQYRKIENMFIVGAYDARHMNPDAPDKNKWKLPFPEIFYLAHMWVFKHYTWSGFHKRNGWNWSHMYASSILKSFDNIEYIFTSNGDCTWERPEGVYELIDILGDNDFMSGQSYVRHTDNFVFQHTCTAIFKRDAYFNFIQFMAEELAKSDTAGVSPESLLQRWLREKNIKYIHAPIQPTYPNGDHDMYCEAGGESTWRNTIGFRNLNAESAYRCHTRQPPLDQKYYDLREPQTYWGDHDKNTLHKYFITGDKRFIQMWHDQDPWQPRNERIIQMRKTLADY